MPTWLKVVVHQETFKEEAVGGIAGFTRANGTRVYRCQADGPVALEEALTANDGTRGVALMGDAWGASRPNCTVTGREPKRVSSKVVDVECAYTDLTGGETVPDLLAKPARLVKLSVQSEMQEYTKDAEGNWVANAVNQPFDKNPERLKSDFVFHIEKYVNAAGLGVLAAAHETNNSGTVVIAGVNVPEDWGLVVLEDFQPVGTSGVYLASYQVAYRRDGWVDNVLNAGFNEVDPSPGGDGYKPIIRGGEPVTKPWPLTEAGAALPDGFDPVNDLVFIDFYPYKQSAWSGVGLPA